MLILVDIDQFLGVNSLDYYVMNGHNILLLRSIRGISYLPKEIFNMTQLKYICANTINRHGLYSYYTSETKVNNHSQCRWTNLVNLLRVRNLNMYSEIIGNKNILEEFISI